MRETQPELERSIGLRQVLFQSFTQMAPGASIVFGLGLIILYTGVASPISLLIAVGAATLVAIAIGQLASRIPSAGGFYSYTSVAFGTKAGYLLGWLYSPMYFVLICANAISFGLIGGDFLDRYLSVTVPFWLLVGIVVAVITWITYLGIRLSTAVTIILGIAEIAIIFVIALLLIIHAGSANSLEPFNPANASGAEGGTFQAIFLGVVYAMALLVGFEASVPLAEEVRNPRRTIPRAVVISVIAIGLFYVFALYAAVVGWPTDLPKYFDSENPWREMADTLGGFFAFMVMVAILNSIIAGLQAGFNAQTRILFAMGRAAVAPKLLARTDRKRHTPYLAAFSLAVTASASIFVTVQIFGEFPAFIFFLTVATIIFLIQYIAVALACVVFFIRRDRRDLNVWPHVVAPILGVAVLGPALWYAMKGLTYPANQAIPVIAVWAALGIAALVLMRVRGADIASEETRWLAEAIHRPSSVGDAPETRTAVTRTEVT